MFMKCVKLLEANKTASNIVLRKQGIPVRTLYSRIYVLTLCFHVFSMFTVSIAFFRRFQAYKYVQRSFFNFTPVYVYNLISNCVVCSKVIVCPLLTYMAENSQSITVDITKIRTQTVYDLGER